MALRRVAANWLHINGKEWLRNGGVSIADNGEITEIFDLGGGERPDVEFHSGILAPGFVNAHTHMELSFFDGVFVPGGSMVAFLRQIDSLRIDINQSTIDGALAKGYETLRADGQVAYADISNAADTVPFKAKEDFESVSFVEVFGANLELAHQAWTTGLEVRSKYHSAGVTAAYMTPHAPYSVGKELWELLLPELEKTPILSLHFAETPQEVEFMSTGGGAIAHLFSDVWKRVTNIPRLDEVMGHLGHLGRLGKRMLLIHCVSLSQELMQQLKMDCPKASVVLCPASNLFIEGRMPPVDLLRQEGMPIAVGTDSLSSSPSLSMLDQLRLLNQYHPLVPLRELLAWATEGGADACGFAGLGRIATGTKPGVNLIQGEALAANSLEGATVRPLANRLGWR